MIDSTTIAAFLVGALAQLVDGALGMGFGLIASSVLIAMGVPPATSSAAVHAAKVFTGGASALSHAWFQNLNWRLFFVLALSGVAGGLIGAYVLGKVNSIWLLAFISIYLAILGVVVLIQTFRLLLPRHINHVGTVAIGSVGGCLDAIGGGGWGSITTLGMVARGIEARYAVGTANAAEFFVAISISAALFAHLDGLPWKQLIALIAGGVVMAPFAAWIAHHLPMKFMAIMVGCAVILLSLFNLWRLVY